MSDPLPSLVVLGCLFLAIGAMVERATIFKLMSLCGGTLMAGTAVTLLLTR